MYRFLAFVPIALFTLAINAQNCADLITIQQSLTVQGPNDATHVAVMDQATPPNTIAVAATPNGTWTISAADVTTLGNAALLADTATRRNFNIQFLRNGTRVGGPRPFIRTGQERNIVCPPVANPPVVNPPVVNPPVANPPANNAPPPEDAIAACNRIGPDQIALLEQERKVRRDPGFTALFFTADGQLCHWNRQFGVEGDPIHVILINDGSLAGTPQAQFAPCALEPAGISAYVPGTFPTLPQSNAAGPILYTPLRLLPRRCFNASVDITVDGRKLDANNNSVPFQGRHTLTQYTRYRTTLQVGTAFTDLHDNTYGLRADGTQMRIFNKGPINEGPEYFASVVIYSFPSYLRELSSRGRYHYFGRDIVNDQGFTDRIGLALGASASNPGRRFLTGISFEIVRGVNLVGMYEWARVKRLVGVKEDDVFAGAENTIPVRDTWESSFAGGISLDFRYVTLLFSRQ
ncbi:MAG TPA: hypothetical protein VF824_10680 [Thermoanaerobaculia bacterium]|jgi:hypothetical protein